MKWKQKSKIVSFRVSEDVYKYLKRVADENRLRVSSYLANEMQKKHDKHKKEKQ